MAPDDVGRQQVGRALDARELAVDRAGEGAGQRRLADARVVLDQHVALGGEGDQEVSRTSSRDLDRPRDVRGDPPRDPGGGVELSRSDAIERLERLHLPCCTPSGGKKVLNGVEDGARDLALPGPRDARSRRPR